LCGGFYGVWETCHEVRENSRLWEDGKGYVAIKSNRTESRVNTHPKERK